MAKAEVKINGNKITITPSRKSKMSQEELENHLHLRRKGASVTKNGKQYKRREKHKKDY